MKMNDRILAVDDQRDCLEILEELLGSVFTVMCVRSGEEAIRLAPQFQPNLVLLDLMMPTLNGRQTCRLLKSDPTLSDTKIIMLSGRSNLEDRLASYEVGAVDYISKPFDHQEVLAKVKAWMQMVRKQEVDKIWDEAEKTRDVIGSALVALAAFRDTETGDHLFRMRWYSQALAEQLAVAGPYRDQIDEPFLQHLYRASPLHDIGKVGIRDAILRKPGPLDAAEFEQIKRHTVIGSEILSQAAARLPHADYLKMAVIIARHHHERFDGAGYPDGIRELEIALAARIVSVADVFDAVTSKRVYKDAISSEEAALIIEQGAGSQFDPEIVAAFQACFEDFRQAKAKFAEGYMTPADYEICPGAALAMPVGQNVDHVEYGF